MSTTYLTTSRFIKAKILSFIEGIFGLNAKKVNTDHKGYKFVAYSKAINFRESSSVGIYKDKKGRKYFIKDYSYYLKGLDYEYLQNEANILNILQGVKIPKLKVNFVRMITSKDEINNLSIITEFAKGKALHNFPKSTITKVLNDVVTYLRKVSVTLPINDFNKIPKRLQILTYLTFPLYLVRALVKEPKQKRLFIKVFNLFTKYAPETVLKSGSYGIAHRDLLSDNILYDSGTKSITIIDPECTVLTDYLLDLALIPRLYIKFLGMKEFIKLINMQNLSKDEKKRLIVLILSASLIKIATEKKGARDYINAVQALKLVVNKLIPEIKKTL